MPAIRYTVFTLVLLAAASLRAQTVASQPDAPWWLSGQINFIAQAHGPFPSPYSGEHSLKSEQEQALSRVWTIYTGARLGKRTELIVDIESAGGRGISDAVGLAGFTNLDVVRNPDLGPAPYVARLMIRHVIPLGDSADVDVERGPLSLASQLPARRIEIRAGKMGLVDFFDLNASGSDSHLQFTNWTIDNNGAYDYAADTRGYTYGVVVELVTPRWTLRGAEALMPTVANGINMDWRIAHDHADNMEFEARPHAGVVLRTLMYVNHANMGSYDEAIAAFRAHLDATPDVDAHRQLGRIKYGFGENVEYAISDRVRVFGRAGWNEGHNESFAYTEVNDTVSLGGDTTGAAWHRPDDRAGMAFASNGLSAAHREYLQLGGLGFILGDGTLTYGRETIVESYYRAQIWRGISASIGGQRIVNPGYNRDRGPVTVGSLRLHVDF